MCFNTNVNMNKAGGLGLAFNCHIAQLLHYKLNSIDL